MINHFLDGGSWRQSCIKVALGKILSQLSSHYLCRMWTELNVSIELCRKLFSFLLLLLTPFLLSVRRLLNLITLRIWKGEDDSKKSFSSRFNILSVGESISHWDDDFMIEKNASALETHVESCMRAVDFRSRCVAYANTLRHTTDVT